MSTRRGFALPTILIAGTALLIMLAAGLVAISTVTVTVKQQYYQKIALEATEAGVAIAQYCLQQPGYTPTWSATAPLRPGNGCTGTTVSDQKFVIDTPSLKTTFLVTGATTDTSGSGRTTVKITGQTMQYRKSNTTTPALTTSVSSVSLVVAQPDFQAVSGNDTHTCAIASGYAYCWGSNSAGQLGTTGTPASSTKPLSINYTDGLIPNSLTDIKTGNFYSCGLSSLKLWCWGENNYGQMATGAAGGTYKQPRRINTGLISDKEITKVAAGANNVCVIAQTPNTPSTARAYCWGWNIYGQLGNNTVVDQYSPVQFGGTVSGLSGKQIKDIDTNDYHTCVVTTDSTANVWCAGLNNSGQLGNGNNTGPFICPGASPWGVNKACAKEPVNSSTIAGINPKSIGTGSNFTCVLYPAVWCWGANNYGQIGDGTTTNRLTITRANGSASATAQVMAVGDYHVCVIVTETKARVQCWGRNTSGQLGDGTTTNRNVPTDVAVSPASELPSNASLTGSKIAVNASDSTSCVVTAPPSSARSVYCWGINSHGQLGDNTVTQRLTPVKFDTTLFNRTASIF